MAGPYSMTGFGRAEVALGSGLACVEVKSVNSRHLDLRVRLPRELHGLEPVLREAAAPFFQRGQVEVAVRLPAEGLVNPEVEVDLPAARSYAEAAERLAAELGLREPLSVTALLELPGVARLREPELATEAAREVLVEGVRSASSSARDMRAREGAALCEELSGRLAGLDAILADIEVRADQVQRGLRERLDKRLAALGPELELEPGRLEQEVVIYADRMDVTEETVRLRSHLAQFHETLEQGGPVGRKLEFLLQEMAREVNTIGSKAQDVSITRCVVELKTTSEKLREQVLNIE